MKPSILKTLPTALLALVLLAVAPCVLAAETAETAADSQTLEGEFVWKRQDKDINGPLKAVFEPTGENTWNVAFYFVFQEEDHVYKGTATGSLSEGELSGEVMTDDEEPRPFHFAGSFDDGAFSGTHWGIRDNGERADTGTLSLGHDG